MTIYAWVVENGKAINYMFLNDDPSLVEIAGSMQGDGVPMEIAKVFPNEIFELAGSNRKLVIGCYEKKVGEPHPRLTCTLTGPQAVKFVETVDLIRKEFGILVDQ